jgi:hypothetical protein
MTIDPDNPALPHMINDGLGRSPVSQVKESAARMNEFFTKLTNKYEQFETRVNLNPAVWLLPD